MTCIDCGEHKPVMLTQTASLGRWRRTWTICVPCHLRYERFADEERFRSPTARTA